VDLCFDAAGVSFEGYLSNRSEDVAAMTMTWEKMVFAEDYPLLQL